ncbi:hypothetical protein [Trichothermofontia sp.]
MSGLNGQGNLPSVSGSVRVILATIWTAYGTFPLLGFCASALDLPHLLFCECYGCIPGTRSALAESKTKAQPAESAIAPLSASAGFTGLGEEPRSQPLGPEGSEGLEGLEGPDLMRSPIAGYRVPPVGVGTQEPTPPAALPPLSASPLPNAAPLARGAAETALPSLPTAPDSSAPSVASLWALPPMRAVLGAKGLLHSRLVTYQPNSLLAILTQSDLGLLAVDPETDPFASPVQPPDEAPVTRSWNPLSAQIEGVYVFVDDRASARARLLGSYVLSPNLMLGTTLELVTGDAFTDSRDAGANLHELYVVASLPQLPTLRWVVGQMDLTAYFDRNSFAKDVALHFMNPVFQSNPALSAAGLQPRPGALLNWAISDHSEKCWRGG